MYVYVSYPENWNRFHWRYFGKEQQRHASRSSSPRSSITPVEEPSNAGSLTELSESNKKKGKKYDTWSQAQKRLLIQLWAENHQLPQSRESQTTWTKICEDVNACMETSKTIEKCIKKMKYLTDRYKEAKEWNRNQSGGCKKQSCLGLPWHCYVEPCVWSGDAGEQEKKEVRSNTKKTQEKEVVQTKEIPLRCLWFRLHLQYNSCATEHR